MSDRTKLSRRGENFIRRVARLRHLPEGMMILLQRSFQRWGGDGLGDALEPDRREEPAVSYICGDTTYRYGS